MKQINYNFLFISIIFLLLIILLSGFIFASSEEYLNEFNYIGETCTIYGEWNYLDSFTNSKHIVDYRCCSNSCLDLLYDSQNNQLLDDDTLLDTSKLVILKSRIDSNLITTSNYNIEKPYSSLVCSNYGIDVFKKQTGNLGTKVAVNDVVPEIASKKAATLIKNIYEAGKTLNVIEDVNPVALVLSVGCVGGDIFENIAVRKAKSCSSYIINEKNGYSYYGMVDDLKDCHEDSINILSKAKFSLNTLFNSAETKFFDGLKCMGSFFKSCNSTETNFEYFTNAITQLEQQSPNLDFSNDAGINAILAGDRFLKKRIEANVSLNTAFNDLHYLQIKIENNSHPIKNIFYEPSYNFKEIKENLSIINDKLLNAETLLQINKFNTVTTIGNTSSNDIDILNSETDIEINKERHLNWLKIIVVIVGILLLFFAYRWVKDKLS
jgi:hypothetical protein